ncbi:hypothetical protein [Acidovorax sp. NCPPB 3576]|uniref:hypothetical protein n=1 Tax=Acidovorax sp. NCPPB 3576 TaxID=2940488 RepID=UPI00234A296A|nr:hypothetical protein [Acidovorax sp. NCPPB 3576]WCM89975.1 hypothetical protein M5C98_08110 [Acidovorax sp. NCPPB 3576]
MRAPSPFFVRSLLRGAWIAAALSPPWNAMAQTPLPASDPLAPASALIHRGVAITSPPVEPGSVAWRDAHAAVAATPRGHADIVAWEARQGGPSAQAAPAAAPEPADAKATAAAAPSQSGHKAHQHHHSPLPPPAGSAP